MKTIKIMLFVLFAMALFFWTQCTIVKISPTQHAMIVDQSGLVVNVFNGSTHQYRLMRKKHHAVFVNTSDSLSRTFKTSTDNKPLSATFEIDYVITDFQKMYLSLKPQDSNNLKRIIAQQMEGILLYGLITPDEEFGEVSKKILDYTKKIFAEKGIFITNIVKTH